MTKSDVIAAGLLLVAVLALWVPVLARPESIAFGLDLAQFYYWEHYARQALAQGVLPLWNPYVFSGAPFLANPQTVLFYPPSALLRLVPIHAAFNWGQWLHIWWAGLAMYALMRGWGCRPLAALLSGASLMLGGFITPRLFAGHVDIIYGVGWTPLALLWASQALQTGRLRPLLGAGVALALQFLSGFPQMVLSSAILIAAYTGFHLLRQARHLHRRMVAQSALSVAALPLIAATLSAVQLLPTLELARWSARASGLQIELAAKVSFRWHDLITLIIPYFYYDPVNHLPFPDELAWEYCGYVGLLPLVLAPLALAGRRRGLALFWTVVVLTSFVLALGAGTPLYPLLWRILPFFRVPGQFLFFWCLGLAALGGLAVEVLAQHPDHGRRALRLFAAGLLSLTVVTVILRVADVPGMLLADPRAVTLMRYNLGTAAVQSAVSGLALVVVARSSWRGRFGALAAALLVDLWIFSRPNIVPANADALLTLNRAVFDAARSDAGQARWAPVQVDYSEGPTILLADQAMALGVPGASGYDPLFLEHYADLMSLVSSQDPVRPLAPDFPEIKTLLRPWILDLLNVRYIFTSDRLPAYRLLLNDVVRVYENPTALPRAFWVGRAVQRTGRLATLEYLSSSTFKPAHEVVLADVGGAEAAPEGASGKVEVSRYAAHRVELTVWADADGWVVLSDTCFPGWRAWVDGEETPVLRADWALRAVRVRAGEHRIVLQYESRLFEIGKWVSAMGLVIVASLWMWGGRQSRAAAARSLPEALPCAD